MTGIVGYGHVAIKVSDLDRSLAFYADLMGFPEMMRLHNDDGSTWLVYLRITDDQFIEIFPGAESDRAPGWNANGVNHMCLAVEDMDETVAALKAKGVVFTKDVQLGLDGNRQAWLEDPDGNRIELMEMAPDSLQNRAIRRLRGEAG